MSLARTDLVDAARKLFGRSRLGLWLDDVRRGRVGSTEKPGRRLVGRMWLAVALLSGSLWAASGGSRTSAKATLIDSTTTAGAPLASSSGAPAARIEVGFQASNAHLWTVGADGNTDWPLGLAAGTSPPSL